MLNWNTSGERRLKKLIKRRLPHLKYHHNLSRDALVQRISGVRSKKSEGEGSAQIIPPAAELSRQSQKSAASEVPSATAPDQHEDDLKDDHRSILDRLVADPVGSHPVLPKKSALAHRAILQPKSPQPEEDITKIRFYEHGKEIDEPLFLSETDFTESESEHEKNQQSPSPAALPVHGSSSFRISPFFSGKVFHQKKDDSSQTTTEPCSSEESPGIPFLAKPQRQQESKFLEVVSRWELFSKKDVECLKFQVLNGSKPQRRPGNYSAILQLSEEEAKQETDEEDRDGFFDGEASNEDSRAQKALVAAKEILKNSPDHGSSLKSDAEDEGEKRKLSRCNSMDLNTENQRVRSKCNSMDLTAKNQTNPGSMTLEKEGGNNEGSVESDTAMDVWDQEEAENLEAYKLDLLARRPYLEKWPALHNLLLGDLPTNRQEALPPTGMEGHTGDKKADETVSALEERIHLQELVMKNTYSGLVWYQLISRCLAAAEDSEHRPKDEAKKDEAQTDGVAQAAAETKGANQPPLADQNRVNGQPPPAHGNKDLDERSPADSFLQPNSTTISSMEGEAEGQKSTH